MKKKHQQMDYIKYYIQSQDLNSISARDYFRQMFSFFLSDLRKKALNNILQFSMN